MIAFRWILASLFMLGFGSVSIGNVVGTIRATREHGYSMVLFLGGLFCAIALLAVPVKINGWWWLLPFLDLGTTFMIFMLPNAIWLILKGPKKRT